MDWVGGGQDSGREPGHPPKKDRRYRYQTEDRSGVHCKALGSRGSGHNFGKDVRGGRERHSLGLGLLHFLVSVLDLQARAEGGDPGPHSLVWGQGWGIWCLPLLPTGVQGPSSTGQRDLKIYSLATSTTGTGASTYLSH